MPSKTSTSGLSHLILNNIKGDGLGLAGTNNPISLDELFDFDSDCWTRLYNSQGRKHLTEELVICELLSQDAMMDKGVQVDVNEMTSEILMAQHLLLLISSLHFFEFHQYPIDWRRQPNTAGHWRSFWVMTKSSQCPMLPCYPCQ